jgi:glycosyltransferase involved in cell wall biosynthesis
MKKNICLVVDTLSEGGGAEKAVLSLAQGLSELNCRVDIIVLNNKKSSYALDQFNFKVHNIQNITHPIRQIRAYKKIKPLKNKIAEIGIDFDLFVAHLGDSRRACRWAKLPNTYYCIHITAAKNKTLKIIKKIGYLIQRAFNNKLNLITVSKGIEKNLLEFGVASTDVQTIYNPFNFDEIRQQANAYQVKEQNYIVNVGRFSMSQKRYDILLKAYKQSGIKQNLLLLGDHENKTGDKVKQLIFDLDLQDKVIFKGFNSNPFPYIKNATALILSSDFEGFGMVLVEALTLHTPIVSTDCPSGPSEILIDELEAFLSPVGDIKALAENIKKMVENPVEITDKYINRFSAEESARQYLALCK